MVTGSHYQLQKCNTYVALVGMDITITEVASARDRVEASALLHDFAEWMAAGGLDLRAAQPAFAAELAGLADQGPAYRLFLARAGWLAVGTVGVRPHDDGTAELKRMYVRPFARGHGVAGRLVARAVRTAEEAGCSELWLETKRGLMDPAIAMYRRLGFRPTSGRDLSVASDGIVVMTHRLRARSRCA